MRTRTHITAALALAVATILAVAACGSTVTGSAQPNTVAAQTMDVPGTEISLPSELASVLPSELAELTNLLTALPTDLSIPTDFTIPTDFAIPTDLTIPTDFGDLNIPGLAPGCLAVSSALFSLTLALTPIYFGGAEAFDSAPLQQAIESLAAQAPPELAGDIATLGEVAAEVNGKTAAEVTALLEDDRYDTAFSNIEAWTSANCGG